MIDFEKIKALYRLTKNLTLADAQVVIKAASTRTLAPGEHLFVPGDTHRTVYFIRKGLLRVYKVTEKGDEVSIFLHWENMVVSNPDILLFEEPSQYYYQTLEQTDLFYMNFDVLQGIVDKHPKLTDNRRYILRQFLKRSMRRVESFVFLTPEERYLEFLKENPDLVHRVPDKHIANVLGITPVSLSRIRKRIASRKK